MNKFKILASDANGQQVECFIWTRDAASGIERAEREAQKFGLNLSGFRAIPMGAMVHDMFARYDLIRLQNHAANVNQDHLTFAGFFTTESEFAALADRLTANIEDCGAEYASDIAERRAMGDFEESA